MSTLAEPEVRASCCERITRLDHKANPKWGRMTAHQMVCHLNDAFRVGAGEMYASPATNLFKRTVVKWIALRSAAPWPHGLPTRPELEQGCGGTPPSNWVRDCAKLHPIFGKMAKRDWHVWGYRHVVHHLRQFGV
jgi:hypothetical protein